MAKKTKKILTLKPISLKNYIVDRARKLPIYKCWSIGDNVSGIKQIIVTRQKTGGKLVVGFFLVDLFCLGLKDTFYREFDDEEELEAMVFSKLPYEINKQEIDPTYAQNLVYGVIEYAEDLGFSPHKEFKVSEYILDDIEELEYIEIEFGKDGKPFYLPGENDNIVKNLMILDANVGKGNYNYANAFDYDDDDDDDDFEEEMEELDYLQSLNEEGLQEKFIETMALIDEGAKTFFGVHFLLLMEINNRVEDADELLKIYKSDKDSFIKELNDKFIKLLPKNEVNIVGFEKTILLLIEQFIDNECLHFIFLESYIKALNSMFINEFSSERFRFSTTFAEKTKFFANQMLDEIAKFLYKAEDFTKLDAEQKERVKNFFYEDIKTGEAEISDEYESYWEDFNYFNYYLDNRKPDLDAVIELFKNREKL